MANRSATVLVRKISATWSSIISRLRKRDSMKILPRFVPYPSCILTSNDRNVLSRIRGRWRPCRSVGRYGLAGSNLHGFSECLEAGVEQGGSVAAGALQAHSRGLLQGVGRGVVTQAEEVANGGEDRVGMVVMKFGDGRADGGTGVVEELILEPHCHVGNGLAVGFAQVGVRGEEGGQLALAELIGVVAELLQQGAGGLLMAHQGAASGGLALNDQKGRIDALLPPQTVLIGLGTQVVDMVEGDLVKVADPGVEIAGDGDVEDERQPVAAGTLNADVLIKADDRLGGCGGADHQVGLDQRLAQAVERDGLRVPASGGGLGSLRVAVGNQDPAGVQGLEVLECQVAHLAGADHQHGLVGERVEHLPGEVDRHAGDRELALVHARPLAHRLADLQRGLKDGMKDRPDRLPLDRGAVGCADLTEDLALAQHQAFQAGRNPKQMSDSPLVVIADEVPREELGPNPMEFAQEFAQYVGLGNGLGAAGQVDLDPVASGEDHELVAGKGLGERFQPPGVFWFVKRQGLAHAGRRGAMIDPHGQQSHGCPPAIRAAPWAVGNLSASIPTHVNTRKAKATIVRTITLRPRKAGRNRACRSTAKTNHMPRALTTLGSVQLRVNPVSGPRLRAFTLRIMPIRSPKVSRGKAMMMAPRLTRSDCSRLGRASPNRAGRLDLSRRIWARYMSPAAKATQVQTAPPSRKMP